MPTINELLQAVTGMQQTAQANVPVVPNNGNPNGANNMPSASGAPVMPSGVMDWSAPSPSMALIMDMLKQPLQPPRDTIGPRLPSTMLTDKTDPRITVPRQPPQPIPTVDPSKIDPRVTGGPMTPRQPIPPVLPVRGAWKEQRQADRMSGDFVLPKSRF